MKRASYCREIITSIRNKSVAQDQSPVQKCLSNSTIRSQILHANISHIHIASNRPQIHITITMGSRSINSTTELIAVSSAIVKSPRRSHCTIHLEKRCEAVQPRGNQIIHETTLREIRRINTLMLIRSMPDHIHHFQRNLPLPSSNLKLGSNANIPSQQYHLITNLNMPKLIIDH
uniref:Uncharacterized protein n=1 Tax=Parascaris univalens TaxID=6257 RepID=A0A914ZNU7_PARUN